MSKNGLLTLVGLLLLGGCQRSVDRDLREYVDDVRSRPGRAIKPIPQFKPMPKFTYPIHLKRRDPFAPILLEDKQDTGVSAPDQGRVKQILEQFPLDSLTMVGTLKHSTRYWALIQGPNNAVFRVRVGDYMGKNFGRITRISPKEIRLLETVKVAGKWQRKPVTIELR